MSPLTLQIILENVRARGLSFVYRTLQRDRLNAAFTRRLPEKIPQAPGEISSVEQLPNGQRFNFQHTTLEIVYLDDSLARVTWESGRPTPPVALADANWPLVSLQRSPSGSGYRLQSAALSLRLTGSGEMHWSWLPSWFDPQAPETWQPLRQELSPQRLGAGWLARQPTHPEEHFYGLGEQAGDLNLRGARRRCWNTDPGGSYAPGADPLYMPVPVYIGMHSQGSYLVFYENAFPSTFDFASAPAAGGLVEAAFEAGQLRYYLIAGTLPHLLERYTALTGRTPLPPRWSLGFHQSRWGYKTAEDVRQVASGFQQHDLPLSAIHLDIDYMDGYRVFTVDKQRFPDLKALSAELAVQGVRLVTILDPGVKRDPHYDVFQDGLAARAFCSLDGRTPYTGLVWPGKSVYPDFTDPAARRWWGQYYPRLLEAGVSGFWHDMNEPTSFGAWGDMSLPLPLRHNLDGQPGDHHLAHNLYALQMNRAGYEALRQHRPSTRPWLLSRSGWAGQQRYAWSWTADTETSWGALRMTLVTVLGMALSGFPYCGPDIGGFSGSPDEELMVRWFQLGSLLPFFRIHSSTGTARREPWEFGDRALGIMRTHLKLRQRLLPYLYTLAWQASQTGVPLVRPLFWQAPDRQELWEVQDAYLLGNDLLVAPAMEAGALSRQVQLPPGEWVDFWTRKRLIGPGAHTLASPLERLPLLVRAGSLLPLAAGGVLDLHLYPGVESRTMQLYSDAGDGYDSGRVDSFVCYSSAPGEFQLTWQTEGDFPLPYRQVSIITQGWTIRRALLQDFELKKKAKNIVELPPGFQGELRLSLDPEN